MNLDLSGKQAIVCGSSQGIGRASAMALANLGATVVLVARNEIALHNVRKELSVKFGQSHYVIAVDFAEADTLKEKVTDYLANAGPVHILVNNTGGPAPGPAIDAAPEAYLDGFAKHLICNQVLTQAVTPGMKSESYGRIINIISTSVKQPIKGLGVSNTIRGAVANWAKTLADELGPFGITVNNVLPGATNTGRLHALIDKKAKSSKQTFEQVADNMRAAIPARRFAEPDELANAVAFLASPAASYINGINLPVDGGRTSSL